MHKNALQAIASHASMSAIFSATIEQCTSNALKRTKFGCILLGFTKLRLAGNGGPLPLVLIKAPAKIEPINGLRCAEPLLSERESAARARSGGASVAGAAAGQGRAAPWGRSALAVGLRPRRRQRFDDKITPERKPVCPLSRAGAEPPCAEPPWRAAPRPPAPKGRGRVPFVAARAKMSGAFLANLSKKSIPKGVLWVAPLQVL